MMTAEYIFNNLDNINFDAKESKLSGDISGVVTRTADTLLEAYYLCNTSLSIIDKLREIINKTDDIKSLLAEKTFEKNFDSVKDASFHPQTFAIQCRKIFGKVGEEYCEKFDDEFDLNKSQALVDVEDDLLSHGETKVVEMAKRLKNTYIVKSKEWLKWQLDNLKETWSDSNFNRMEAALLKDIATCEESLRSLFSELDNIPSASELGEE